MGKLLEAVRAKNGGALSPEQERFVTGIEEAMKDEISSEVRNAEEGQQQRLSETMTSAIEKVVGAMPADKEGKTTTVIEQLRGMAEQMDKLESISRRGLSGAEKYNLRKKLEDNRDAILSALKPGSKDSVEISFSGVRAPAMMTTQNLVVGANTTTAIEAIMDNEIAYIRYPENWVLDIIRSREVSKVPARRVKREQNAREGQAVVVPEGTTKPLISYSFSDTIFDRIKIAGRMEWTEEVEIDFEELFNRVIDLFERDILRDWQNILLNRIITTASTYVSTALDGTIPFPNIYTAIGAAILSIQSLEFQPNVIWMNPADVWAMNLSQDTTGQMIIPPIMVGNNQIAGMRLYVSNIIEPGHSLIGDSSTWSEEHTGFISRIGYYGNQFIDNEKTMVGEVFSLMYQAIRDKGSWIYVDLNTVMEALQKPTA